MKNTLIRCLNSNLYLLFHVILPKSVLYIYIYIYIYIYTYIHTYTYIYIYIYIYSFILNIFFNNTTMSQLGFSVVTLLYFTFVHVTVMHTYSKRPVIHIISIAVDRNHNQRILRVLLSAVLIKWPLENL